MMGRALLFVGGGAVAGFLAAGILGFGAVAQGNLRLHLLVGFLSVLLLLLSQVWILIFLIASARAVRSTVAAAGLGASGLDLGLVAETHARLRRLAPCLAAAVVLTVATFAVGPQMFGGGVPHWLHSGLAVAALVAQVCALLREWRELDAHALRLGELARAVEA